MTKDKKGRVKQDDANMAQEMASAGFGADQGYEAFVFYEFEII